MYKIRSKKVLVEDNTRRIVQFTIEAPLIPVKACAGQFVVLMINEQGERFPLTVVDKDIRRGTLTLIVQEVGLTTKLLGNLSKGDALYALAGPLGHPTEIKKYGNVIVVGGGVGIAEIYPVAKALKEAGNRISAVLGARTKKLLILEKEIKKISDKLYTATEDGSYGKKGFVTDILKELLNNCNLIYAVGPIPMMRAVSVLSKPYGIKTIVSLNALMVDATGMCGSCRVSVAKETRFACIDGPEFDGHLVDWDELEKRSRIYERKEKHICKLL